MKASGLIAGAAMAALAGPLDARPAQCLLLIYGQEYIRGECNFDPFGGDGFFTISTYSGRYFAYINMVGNGIAEGSWNGETYAGHAHDFWGTLYREDACWVNDIASVCAW